MNQNFNQNGFQQNQQFGQQSQQQQGFQQPQQNFQQPQQQGGGMFIDTNQAPSAGNGTLPKGQYPVRVTNAEYKQNNGGTGWILALENTVTAGLFAGRKIFDNYNMQHTNETAQNIGQANYAKLCQSIYGNPNNRPQNPQVLIGAEYVIDYGVQKKKSTNNTYQPEADETAEVQMEVKDRLPLSAYHAANQQQPQQQVMTQQAFGQQQPNNQQGNFQQQPNQQLQQNQNQQQQPQQNFNQQQFHQPQNQQFNQQQGFPQQTADATGAGQQQAGNQQNGFVQGAEGQGQNGNGQGNGAPQGDNSANGNPGNVNGTPFNQGAGNGFGQGFGSM